MEAYKFWQKSVSTELGNISVEWAVRGADLGQSRDENIYNCMVFDRH